MSESTLSLDFSDIKAEVGAFLGWGRTESGWSDDQADAVESVIKSGLRNFYYPAPSQGVSHEWSFLRPRATLVVPSGSAEVDLPDECGGIDGRVYYAGTDTAIPCELPHTSEGQILSRRAEVPSMTARPTMCAVRPKTRTTADRGQRFELMLWPTSDAIYTITFQFNLLPDALTGIRPWPLGGMAHAETILESCLAVAESRLDDTQGVHKAAFMERMAASITADRRMKPAFLGYNGDRSDRVEQLPRDRHGYNVVTYNGVEY